MTVTLNKKERNRILSLFLIGIFMGCLDMGIVGPVLSPIQNTFHITSRESSWIYTIYIIAFMIGSPIMAKFSDFYGQRKLYIIEIILFGLGSASISIAPSMEVIFIGRIIQGFGAGGLFPVVGSFIGDYFPIKSRGTALGIIGATFGLSTVAGPLVGAAIIPFGWNWCFAINIPISIILLILSYFLLPQFEQSNHLDIDWSGIILLILCSTLFAYGLNQIDSSNFVNSLFSIKVLPYLVLFIILLPIFIKIEKRATESIVPIYLFKNKEISTASILVICEGIINAATIFVPSLAMISLGYNDELASLMLIPLVGANAVAAPILGKYLFKLGYKIMMIVGTFILSVGLVILGFFATNLYIFLIADILIGLGLVTLIGAPMRFLIMCETSHGERGVGQAIINMMGSVGQLIGGALIGGIIASYNIH
ncbi:MFS transporter [Methanobrevibacter sp. 87.7]|uniref:MFS transporter n=1 Tax=Methanobrevibacter sp. 87.7 TaxID=387957 RepID=UPI000B4FDFA5|nr:MFS transporter [Methanobrevibacter sp. 87.7]